MVVSLIPLSVLGFKVYHAAWDNAWREINEKHRLLAMNMAAPIQIYIKDKQHIMGILAQNISRELEKNTKYSQIHKNLVTAAPFLNDFHSLSLIDINGNTKIISSDHLPTPAPVKNHLNIYRDNTTFKEAIKTKRWSISSVKRSQLTKNPTIFMAYPVVSKNKIQHILVTELKIDELEKLRKNIHFGDKGHSAIVDNKGNALAHPNPQWMAEIKSLSHLKIVQQMIAGESGVTEFWSPFVKQMMVAGFTSVPKLGWGIMVPQPKIEVEKQVNKILFSQLVWALIGLIIAIALAIMISRHITSPINKLAHSAQELLSNELEGKLPEISRSAPYEVQELNRALVNLISGLQKSRTEISSLNESLQDKVDEATSKLTITNMKLKDIAENEKTASQIKSNFIASMSHELRTPLNAIIGYSDLLIEEFSEIPDSIYLSDIKRIKKSGQHLLLLINDILDISKIETGKIDLIIEEINITDMLDDIQSILSPLIAEKSNAIHFNNKLNITVINTDKVKLKQILLNLLSNANKFTNNGDVIVELNHIENDIIEISVKDTGIGIKKDKLESIFDAYNQADNHIKYTFGGTGLGLSISRHYARMLKGDITVTSIEGKQSIFTLTLSTKL